MKSLHRLLVMLLVCFILLGRLTGRKTISLYSGHCRDFELVSSLARVYFSQTSVNLFLARDLAAIGVSVIAGCPQGES